MYLRRKTTYVCEVCRAEYDDLESAVKCGVSTSHKNGNEKQMNINKGEAECILRLADISWSEGLAFDDVTIKLCKKIIQSFPSISNKELQYFLDDEENILTISEIGKDVKRLGFRIENRIVQKGK